MPVTGLERRCQDVLAVVLVTVILCVYPGSHSGAALWVRETGMSQMPSKYSLHQGMAFTRRPGSLLSSFLFSKKDPPVNVWAYVWALSSVP